MKMKGKKTSKVKTHKNYSYSEKYKMNLLQYVKKSNSAKTANLSELIQLKIQELSNCQPNTKEENLFIIFSLSLYFIKDDDFIKEEYFEQIDNSIYKIFNEFYMNPTEEQHIKFLQSFEHLSNGFNNIYLVCKKLIGNNIYLRDKPVDYFFKIILKEHFPLLKEEFSFPIINDQKVLLANLTHFIRIQYNYKEVSKEEAFELFKEATNIQDTKDNNTNKVEEAKDTTEDMNKKIDNKESDDLKDNENKNTTDSKNDIVNTTFGKSLTIFDKFSQNYLISYLEVKQAEYKKMNYNTKVLDYLIEHKLKLKTKYFQNTRDENNFIDHLYDYLEVLSFSINSNIYDLKKTDKIGYICYYDSDKKVYLEGIYSNIDLNFLFEKVVSDENFPADDINNPNENIARNAFKSRALSFEYFINKIIVLERLKAKERQRVIYFFRNIKDIEILSNEDNYEENKSQLQKCESFLVEVDGVILEKEEKQIELEKNFFIVDAVNKFGYFENPEMIVNYHESENKIIGEESDEKKDNNYNFKLKKNCLCVIEIKNQFPPYLNEEMRKNLYKKNANEKKKCPINFCDMVKALVKKALVFKEMFEQLKEKVDSIKLVLFYDAVHKINYDLALCEAMNDLFKTKNEKLISMIEFQCIYIKSSYLAGEYFNLKREMNKVLKEMEDMRDKMKEMEDLKAKVKEMDDLKAKMKNLETQVKQLMDEKKASEKNAENKNEIKENAESKIKEKNDSETKKAKNDVDSKSNPESKKELNTKKSEGDTD